MSRRPIKCDICHKNLGTDFFYQFKLKEENWASENSYKVCLCEICYKNMIQYCMNNIERSEKE